MGLPAKSPQAILWGPRKEGEQHSPRDVLFILTPEYDAPSELALHEFTYNSETNGRGKQYPPLADAED